MFKNILQLVFGTLLVAQLCRADAASDAGDVLNLLRLATSEALNAGFLEHQKMSTDVDTAAFDAKDAGGDDVTACVNEHAEMAIDLIYQKSSGLTDSTLKTIYDDEKEIVFCGRADTECLAGVTDEITTQIAGVTDLINAEIAANREEVDGHIAMISACGQA